MPQVQVIERSPDPTAQIIQQGSQGVADMLMKRQAMELTKQELVIKAKATKNDLEKASADRKIKLVEFMQKMNEQGGTKEMIAAQLHMLARAEYNGNEQLMFEDMGLAGQTFEHYAEVLSGSKGTQASKRVAETQKAEADASYQNRASAMLAAMSGEQAMQPPMSTGAPAQPVPAQASPVPAGDMGAARQGAMQGQNPSPVGGYQMGNVSFGPSGPTFNMTNPEQELKNKMREKMYLNAVDQQKEIAGIGKMYSVYEDTLSRAYEQMGGSAETALGQRTKAFVYGGVAELGASSKYGEIAAARRMQDAVGLSIASMLNRGRPNEKDWESAVKIVQRIEYPPALNRALKRLTDVMFEDPVEALNRGDTNRAQELMSFRDSSLSTEGDIAYKKGDKTFYKNGGNPAFQAAAQEINDNVIVKSQDMMKQLMEAGYSAEDADKVLEKMLIKKGYL